MTIPKTKLKKWQVLKSEIAYSNPWFPIEKRAYKMPNGRIVPDFTITTLADVAMIVPVTKEKKVVMVRQFKPGFGEIILEFPAGRMETHHPNIEATAQHELEEETGLIADHFEYIGIFSAFVTKATEKIFCYVGVDCEFSSHQQLDPTEDIEVLEFSPSEIDKLIAQNQIPAAVSVAAWVAARQHFLELLQ